MNSEVNLPHVDAEVLGEIPMILALELATEDATVESCEPSGIVARGMMTPQMDLRRMTARQGM
jgi:hypothetical protein